MTLALTDKTLKKLSPKDTVEAVFEEMGGRKNMVAWAKANPSTYYVNLYGKLISQPIDLNLTGGIRIDLPWLTSRPGREPVALEHDQPLQICAETAVCAPPQQDPEAGVRSRASSRRKNSRISQ